MPVVGAFAARRTWRLFRARFDELRAAPLLDYRLARSPLGTPAEFRFFGGFESLSGSALWLRNERLTISADLTGARIFLLPAERESGSGANEREPRRIALREVAALSEGARVFVGGRVRSAAGSCAFVSEKGTPLLVILYDGEDRSLLTRTVRAGRQRNEYWNPATPFALAAGIFCHLLMALSFANRPAFAAAFAAALTGAFGPLLPYLPPGILFTGLSRAAWRRGRERRALRDLARLPLRHLSPNETEARLPDGSRYGRVAVGGLLRYGQLNEAGTAVAEPDDPSAAFEALPGEPEQLAASYSARARLYEAAAAAAMFCGTALNAGLAYYLLKALR